jgi:transposase InsO family protein
MAKDDNKLSKYEQWARFRFSVIGRLLSAPPRKGEKLADRIAEAVAEQWSKPGAEIPQKVGFSTVERWYYAARGHQDPIRALRKKSRKDRGIERSLSEPLKQATVNQYSLHKGWSYKLHHDNLLELAKTDTTIGKVPAYSTLRRFMQARGLRPRPNRGDPLLPGVQRAEQRLEEREVRSYEVEYPNSLWHLDFHAAHRQVVTPNGQRVTPHVLAVLDDYSRLCCHLQWYLEEDSTENLVHAFCQALMKRGLPRSLLSDNGGPMIADETEQGLSDCSIVHDTTLPRSPYQNGKQENFWAQVEGRLMAMLERVPNLTLPQLNEATLAWAEMEYNRKVHSETRETPLARWTSGKDVGRECPGSDVLRLRFTRIARRTQRRSDGTVSIEGVRFEIPARFRHLDRLTVRYARWDLAHVWVWDEVGGKVLAPIFPLDKAKNADGNRRFLPPPPLPLPEPTPERGGLPPLMKAHIESYRATGLPPAYLPKPVPSPVEGKENE